MTQQDAQKMAEEGQTTIEKMAIDWANKNYSGPTKPYLAAYNSFMAGYNAASQPPAGWVRADVRLPTQKGFYNVRGLNNKGNHVDHSDKDKIWFTGSFWVIREGCKVTEWYDESTPASPWQPIETAPKDGTMIDLYIEKVNNRLINCWWLRNEKKWCSHELGIVDIKPEPTHWMPLPPLPQRNP